MDTPETLAAAMLKAAAAVVPGAAAVVKRGAQNIKDEGRANVLKSAPVHNAGAYKAITYDDPTITRTSISSEIGYDKNIREGRLGNLLEYGGGGDHSPPHRDIGRATDNEEKRFGDALEAMVERLL